MGWQARAEENGWGLLSREGFRIGGGAGSRLWVCWMQGSGLEMGVCASSEVRARGCPDDGQAGEGRRTLLLEVRATRCPGRAPEGQRRAAKVQVTQPAPWGTLEVRVDSQPQEAPGGPELGCGREG